MNDSGKHTVYIDVDEEITSIIEKVKASPEKIVALVLPKRATVLQSVVNMKLLKKSALAAKKNLVLITSEVGLMPLAGSVGLHVAKSLQSKPQIPLPPDRADAEDEISVLGEDEVVDRSDTVGNLSDKVDQDDTETIELDDVDVETDTGAPESNAKKLAKRFKIPNFDRFRLSFFLAILGVILLIGGWIMAAVVLPQASVVIKTDTTTFTSDINFTANTAFKDLDVSQALVPATLVEAKKADTEKATATGKKDNGVRASGTVTLSIACASVSGTPPTIPAGTGVSSGGQTFITDAAVSLTTPSFSPCKFYGSTTITAQNPGPQYNFASGQAFTVAGYSSVTGSNAAAIAGGTTNVVTVLTQSDIDAAVTIMKGRQDTAATTELQKQLKAANLKGLDETKTTGTPAITSNPAVGAEAPAEVTVTSTTIYNILGVRQDYLSQLIKKDSASKIDPSKQSILDDGLGASVIRLVERKSPNEARISLHSIVVAGAQLDSNSIKEEIRGKKRGDAENIINAKPGVKEVTITYKPFWVLSTPKSTKKINVTIQNPQVIKAQESQTSNGSNP